VPIVVKGLQYGPGTLGQVLQANHPFNRGHRRQVTQTMHPTEDDTSAHSTTAHDVTCSTNMTTMRLNPASFRLALPSSAYTTRVLGLGSAPTT
jgi:hypothetical protein